MEFLSSLFSRLASSSSSVKLHLYRSLRASLPSIGTRSSRSDAAGDRLLSWSRALIPLAVAAIALDHRQVAAPSLCDPGLDLRFRGKDSTDLMVKGARREVSKEFIQELKDILHDNMTLDYDERCFHGKPQHSFHRAVNVPDVVVFPRSQDAIQKIVIACNKHKVPIVPYGGATSIEGQTLAPHGGVCIDMSLMNKIKSLNVEDLDVIVEPGIGWIELNEYLKPYGLFFPLDPGPGATIGGMCATRCSGSLAVRYRTMRENIINLQVVVKLSRVVHELERVLLDMIWLAC